MQWIKHVWRKWSAPIADIFADSWTGEEFSSPQRELEIEKIPGWSSEFYCFSPCNGDHPSRGGENSFPLSHESPSARRTQARETCRAPFIWATLFHTKRLLGGLPKQFKWPVFAWFKGIHGRAFKVFPIMPPACTSNAVYIVLTSYVNCDIWFGTEQVKIPFLRDYICVWIFSCRIWMQNTHHNKNGIDIDVHGAMFYLTVEDWYLFAENHSIHALNVALETARTATWKQKSRAVICD